MSRGVSVSQGDYITFERDDRSCCVALVLHTEGGDLNVEALGRQGTVHIWRRIGEKMRETLKSSHLFTEIVNPINLAKGVLFSHFL